MKCSGCSLRPDRSTVLLRVTLLETTPTPILSRRITPLLRVALGDEHRNFTGVPVVVHGDEREVAGVRVPSHARDQIFGFDANSDLHGRSTHEVDARLEHDEVTEVNGLPEVYPVDGRGHASGAGMPDRRDRGGLVDQRHHDSAEYVPEVIGVRRKHERRGLVLRLAHGSARAGVSDGHVRDGHGGESEDETRTGYDAQGSWGVLRD